MKITTFEFNLIPGYLLTLTASSFMQFQPTTALAPAFPHTGALLPTIAPAPVDALPSNASLPTVISNNAPQHIPTQSNASPQPTLATVSSATGPSDASFPPPVQNKSQPSQFSSSTPFFTMQFQPTPAPVPAFPHTSALLPTIIPAASPSNASSPPVISNNAPQHIQAPSDASPQPTTTPVSPATAPSDASSHPPVQNIASPQHAAAIVQLVHTNAENDITPLSPSFNSDSPLSQIAKNRETPTLFSTSSSIPLNQADGRQSGRNPVPSKCHEQMNQIDRKAKNKTTATDHIEKEDIPSTVPKWTIASHNHLLMSDLGKDWTACVQAWFELKQELGYGSQPGAKVCLFLFLSQNIS